MLGGSARAAAACLRATGSSISARSAPFLSSPIPQRLACLCNGYGSPLRPREVSRQTRRRPEIDDFGHSSFLATAGASAFVAGPANGHPIRKRSRLSPGGEATTRLIGAFRRCSQKPRRLGAGNAGGPKGRGWRMKFIPPGLALDCLFGDLPKSGA